VLGMSGNPGGCVGVCCSRVLSHRSSKRRSAASFKLKGSAASFKLSKVHAAGSAERGDEGARGTEDRRRSTEHGGEPWCIIALVHGAREESPGALPWCMEHGGHAARRGRWQKTCRFSAVLWVIKMARAWASGCVVCS
jgi:hypothetical protein